MDEPTPPRGQDDGPIAGWAPPPRRESEPGLDRVVKIVALAFVGVLFAAFVGGCLYTWATAPSPAETASTEAPVSNPAPGNSPVSQSLPAGQTKAVLDSFVDAMIEWQYSFEPIYDDIYDETLALEQFGVRTEAARARLHTSLAAMKAAIPADIDPALGDILNELVGAFTDKTTGIDDLAAAAKASDRAASGVALDKWGAGLERQQPAIARFIEAARPYLTPAELAEWDQLLRAD